MRKDEVTRGQSVATRIKQFETANNDNNNKEKNNNNNSYSGSKRTGGTPNGFGSASRYLDLDDIIEESSIETDDGAEEEEEDSDGYLAASNGDSSGDTSFRLSGRSSSSSSDRSASDCSPTVASEAPPKTAISGQLSQKSVDSGFSDHSDCRETSQEVHLKSAVVHETHSNRDKLHHVSKVYFYSVSDILQNSSSTELEDQVNLLRREATSEEQQQAVTPRINSSVCDEEFFDRVESPFLPISSPREVGSPFQRWPRVHTGTSSLRRKGVDGGSPGGSRVVTPSQSPFPLTNGSLYSELSLRKERRRDPAANTSQDTLSQTSLSLEDYGLDLSCSSLRSTDLSTNLQQTQLNTGLQQTQGELLPREGPVASWLAELANVQESECTIMLQSKPVRRATGEESGERAGIADVRERITMIQERAHSLSSMFANICRQVESRPRLVSQVHHLTHQIQLFFLECQNQHCGPVDYSHFPGYARNKKNEKSVGLAELRREQERLLYLCDSIKLSVTKEEARVPLIKLITMIGTAFSRVVELMLSIQVCLCVERLVEGGGEVGGVLSTLTSLALEGNALCRLLVRAGAVRRLLALCASPSSLVQVRVAGLRALGSICCVLEGIRQFREARGAVMVVEVLADKGRGEEERREAAGVLAQVMSPWIEGNCGMEEAEGSLTDIVFSLRDLIASSSSLETFLLCSAALANLTSMLPSSLPTVSSSNLLPLILSHSAASSSSIYILEQLVTVTVNMAKLASARGQLVRAGATQFLFSVLSLGDREEQAEAVVRAATERTVSKAAIGLARLCLDPTTADSVVRLGGLDKLFPLAEGGSEQCETIRIAAMAAIKTISVYSSVEQSKQQDGRRDPTTSSSLESFV